MSREVFVQTANAAGGKRKAVVQMHDEGFSGHF